MPGIQLIVSLALDGRRRQVLGTLRAMPLIDLTDSDLQAAALVPNKEENTITRTLAVASELCDSITTKIDVLAAEMERIERPERPNLVVLEAGHG